MSIPLSFQRCPVRGLYVQIKRLPTSSYVRDSGVTYQLDHLDACRSLRLQRDQRKHRLAPGWMDSCRQYPSHAPRELPAQQQGADCRDHGLHQGLTDIKNGRPPAYSAGAFP